MIESFWFSELEGSPRSEFLVEFFEDSYENLSEMVNNLMEALKALGRRTILRSDDVISDFDAFSTSTFVCFTVRKFTEQAMYNPPPDAATEFWRELNRWTRNNEDDQTLQFFDPSAFKQRSRS
jgi:hypothetical protein